VLAPTSTPTPPDVGQVVNAADRLFSAVPTGDLEIVIHQLALAFAGRAQDIRTLIEQGDVLSQTTVDYQDQFRQLLADAPPVLDTVAAVGPQLHDALGNTQTLLDLLNQRKNDIINLFHTGTAFAEVTNQVVQVNSANLACLAKDLGDVGANLSAQPNLSNLDAALQLNTSFFGPVNAITPSGPAASLGPGSPARNDQTWVRVRLLLPPQQPFAVTYPKPNVIPDTYPGAACLSVFGNGVPAGHQANAAPPIENGVVIPPTAPTVPVEALPPPSPVVGGGGPGNVIASSASSAAAAPPASSSARSRQAARTSGHPETAVFVVAGIVGLGRLERRELRKLRRALTRRRRARAHR